MATLYGFPGSANLAAHIVLEELGLPFEWVALDRAAGAHHTPEFLSLNPSGRVPVWVDGELVLSETAAIVLHLADTHPESGLAPAVGTPERARFYQHLMYLTNTLQAEAHPFFYPDQHTTDPSGIPMGLSATIRRWDAMFDLVDGVVAEGPGPWLMGDRYTVVDPFLTMLVRWGRHLPRPARTRAHLAAHAERVLARPAVQRALATEGIGGPVLG